MWPRKTGRWGGYFYPRPPRGGRHISSTHAPSPMRISIHALREEGDVLAAHFHSHEQNFYPRPPRGGRLVCRPACKTPSAFLSTPSARRATHEPPPQAAPSQFLSTPSARRATHFRDHGCFPPPISIHALREEGDHPLGNVFYGQNAFLSTPSARRATSASGLRDGEIFHFYPRPPRGGRPDRVFFPKGNSKISIHALREEGDFSAKTV